MRKVLCYSYKQLNRQNDETTCLASYIITVIQIYGEASNFFNLTPNRGL